LKRECIGAHEAARFPIIAEYVLLEHKYEPPTRSN
jgi:hypothetical protein